MQLPFASISYFYEKTVTFFCFYFQQPVNNADFIIPVEIDGTVHQVCNYSLLALLSSCVAPVTSQEHLL